MSTGGDSSVPPPPVSGHAIPNASSTPRSNNSRYLLDPNASPRLKAIVVAMSSWCELHQLCLRAHDLLSTAHLNRMENIPEGLYHLYENLRMFERRFAAMLVKVNQYPDPAQIVFFAKTFSERIFHAGENIETQLSPNLARAAQTRAEFRRQLQDAEIGLYDYEGAVYESENCGRSNVDKVFLPQPHPLEYIPVSIEPSYFQSTSSPESSGLFAAALEFLKNRRRQLGSTMQTMNQSRFRSEYTSLDVRDFHHEVDAVESEVVLISLLQRLLTTVKMMEDVRGNRTPTLQSSTESNFAAMLRETVDLFQPIRRTINPLQCDTADRNIFGTSRTSLTTDQNLGFSSLSIANVNSNVSNTNFSRGNISCARNVPGLPSSRLSEPMTHSWMVPGYSNERYSPIFTPELYDANCRQRDREIDRSRNITQAASRGRWVTPDHLSHSNLNEPTTRQTGRWNDSDYMSLGEEFNRDGYSRNTINSSAFSRVQRNIGNTAPHVPSRASSVADTCDFGNNQNNENELNDVPDQMLAHSVMAGYDRHHTMLQELTSRVMHLGLAVRANGNITQRNNSHLTDLVIAMDELTRSVSKVQEDITILKAHMSGHSTLVADTFPVNIPTRNRSDDHWRNIDTSHQASGVRNERSAMNILNRSWESSSQSPASGLRESSNAAFRDPLDIHSSLRFNFNSALPAERNVPSATAVPGSREQFEPASGSNSRFMLNNQIPPGNRANNYWDNFKSYSRLNLLSDAKTNIPGFSPSGGMEEPVINSFNLSRPSSPSLRRDSRNEDRPSGPSTIRASFSANFVENIGQKKRNKNQKKQFSSETQSSPINLSLSSSNSSTCGSLNDLIVRSRSSNLGSHDVRRPSNPRDAENQATSSPLAKFCESRGIATSSAASKHAVEHPLDTAAVVTATAALDPILSPPLSLDTLEVGMVSRDEFLCYSGAGSSASGNGKSDDGGGPSSSSSRKELEKLLPSSEEFNTTRRTSRDHEKWQFDLDEMRSAVAKPEPDLWSWPNGEVGPDSSHHENENQGGDRVKKSSSCELDRKE